MNETETERGERPNKTRLKREIAARAALIEKMTALSDAELRRLGLPEQALGEIARVRAIRPSGARKRQLKFCLKQLRDVDLAPVEAYLDDRRARQLAVNQAFHRLEQWRDRLIEEGDGVIGELRETWPQLDRQHLRQLARDARREREHGKPAGAGRRLFRHLRELMEQADGDT